MIFYVMNDITKQLISGQTLFRGGTNKKNDKLPFPMYTGGKVDFLGRDKWVLNLEGSQCLQ